jgi:hypothetical protein
MNDWTEKEKERMALGQSIRDFCKQNRIGISTYYKRQKKVQEADSVELAERQSEPPSSELPAAPESVLLMPPGWAQLTEAENKSGEKQLTVEVGGCLVKVSLETDEELLIKTCRLLRTI